MTDRGKASDKLNLEYSDVHITKACAFFRWGLREFRFDEVNDRFGLVDD